MISETEKRKGKRKMSEKEKKDAVIIAEAYAKMTEEQKQYFLGYAQATVDAAKRRTDPDHPPEKKAG